MKHLLGCVNNTLVVLVFTILQHSNLNNNIINTLYVLHTSK